MCVQLKRILARCLHKLGKHVCISVKKDPEYSNSKNLNNMSCFDMEKPLLFTPPMKNLKISLDHKLEVEVS